MASLTGRVYVPWPNALVPRPGLFQVATGPLDLPVRGRIGGLQYETGTCAIPDCYEVECQATHNSKSLDNLKTTVTADPFVVYSSLLCAPVGLTDQRVHDFLYQQLAGGEQAVVESTFSQQACAQAPGLANNAAVVNLTPTPGTPVDPVKAVSLLENWLYARYGLPGVLHIPAALDAYFDFLHLGCEDSRGNWHTRMGTKMSFGNYAGLTPAGAAPAAGETFMYITGQVAIWRTGDADLFVTSIADTLNRTTNQVTAVMEREYVVSFDCFVAAVETKLTGVVA
jgi:hypothetical protein